MPTYTHNEATVVAASLRCLVVSHDIIQVSGHWSIRNFPDEDEYYFWLADVERNPAGETSGVQPSVDVSKMPIYRLILSRQIGKDCQSYSKALLNQRSVF